MIFRFKHIKRRFIFQVILFIVYAVLVLITIRLYIAEKERLTSSKIELLECDNLLQRVNQTYSDYLLNTDQTEYLITDTENPYFLRFNAQTDNLRQKIIQINNNLNLYRNEELNLLISQLYENIDSCKVLFEQLHLTIIAKGYDESGAVSRFKEISEEITGTLYSSGDTTLIKGAYNLKNLENIYLLNPNNASLANIITVIDDLLAEEQTRKVDPENDLNISASLEQYRTQLVSLNNTIERIGKSSGNSGLIPEFEMQFSSLENVFNDYNTSSLDKIDSANRLVFWIILITIALFTILYSLIILQLMQKIRMPLKNIIHFSYQLSKGKLQTKKIETDQSYEYSIVTDQLVKTWEALKEKKKFVDNLLKQKFDADLTLQGKNDSFGKTLWALKENMRKTRDEQIKNAEENNLRRFLNEGIAKFADILRSNADNFQNLTDEFIKELVLYLDSIQGGLFLYNDDGDEQLHLTSAFAYNRKKYLNKTIAPGEGLVGACALEKKYINLSDIPEDYLEITSGLGDTPPNNLLLIPVVKEDQLLGVIELASLNKFENHQIEVAENIADSLASSIIAARTNERTSKLLEQSQRQAAEMAEQEEEMRQNMEELKATQEESYRREEELEGLLNSINEAFYQLQYDTEGKIIRANEKILFLLDKKVDKVIGKSHTEIFGKKSKVDSLFFANISEGNVVEFEENVEINKKPFTIKNIFSPIKNKDGKTVRILNIITVKV